jgi:hypothetical protein
VVQIHSPRPIPLQPATYGTGDLLVKNHEVADSNPQFRVPRAENTLSIQETVCPRVPARCYKERRKEMLNDLSLLPAEPLIGIRAPTGFGVIGSNVNVGDQVIVKDPHPAQIASALTHKVLSKSVEKCA